MKKQIFKVKDKWKIVDLMVFIFMFVIPVIKLMGFATEMINNSNVKNISPVELLFIVIAVTALTFPGLIIYIIIRICINKNKRKSITFEAINDIQYYRNDFGEVSPALISLMANLDIENHKDITAMLLYYKLKNIIKTSNNIIIINKQIELSESDKCFFKWFESKSVFDLKEWKNSVKQDGINQGYIEKEKNSNIGCVIPVVLLIISIILFIIIQSVNVIDKDDFVIPIVISIFVINNLFQLSLVYFISDKMSRKNIKRTKKGHELTEKIYAMKNFIRDFSNLSRANKESLCLWDYFLIYAIVLEENETILDEIKGYYNDDSLKILLYEENLVDKNINTW